MVFYVRLWCLSLGLILHPSTLELFAQKQEQMVRLAVIVVDTTLLDQYNALLKEEIDASIKKEPGVITLYGVAEKEHPERVTLFETYADSSQYKSHLATPHFQKYKQGTLHMVTKLDLIEMQPIIYHRKAELSTARAQDLYVRLLKIELEPNGATRFTELNNTVMLPGISKEPGLLVMYALAEKDYPTRVSILEVYESLAAYDQHVRTPHYVEYEKASNTIVKSLQILEVSPIHLGAKPQ